MAALPDAEGAQPLSYSASPKIWRQAQLRRRLGIVRNVTRETERRAEFWTRERCFSTELMNSAEQPEVSLARARVEPGVTTELHSLSVSEWYILEAGEGLISVADADPFVVRPGDVVAVEKHAAQQITSTGKSDLIFLCVCVPRFSPECYTSHE